MNTRMNEMQERVSVSSLSTRGFPKGIHLFIGQIVIVGRISLAAPPDPALPHSGSQGAALMDCVTLASGDQRSRADGYFCPAEQQFGNGPALPTSLLVTSTLSPEVSEHISVVSFRLLHTLVGFS